MNRLPLFPSTFPRTLVHHTLQRPRQLEVGFTGPKRRPQPAGYWVAVGWVSPETLVVEV